MLGFVETFGNEMPLGHGKGGCGSGGCGNCSRWPPWWAKLVFDEWSKDATTQTDFSDQADSSISSSCDHSFTTAIDCIIKGITEPEDEVIDLEEAEVQIVGEVELEHVEEAELEVVEQVEVLQELPGGIIEQYLGEQATMSQLDSSNDSLFMLPLVGNVEEYFTIA